MEKYSKIKYAGFWVRSIASLLDLTIVSIPFILLVVLFGRDSVLNIPSLLAFILLFSFYSILFLSSSWSATIGKKIVGIRVLTNSLKPLSLRDSFKRLGFSLISYGILFSPFVLLLSMLWIVNNSWEYLGFLIVCFPLLILLFNRKKQVLHDILANTVVIDPYYKITKSIRIIRGFGLIFVLLSMLFLLMVFYLNIFIYPKADSFHQQNYTNHFNDKGIIFYNKALQKYTQSFINATEVYGLFEMDTKKNIALTCIRTSLKEHNASHWIEILNGFENNARNRYANTSETIQKAKKNEQYMGEHFYEYHLNDISRVIEGNTHICKKLLPIDDIYDTLILQYIRKREMDLYGNRLLFHGASSVGRFNKDFYEKQIYQGVQWLNILYQKYPNSNKSL